MSSKKPNDLRVFVKVRFSPATETEAKEGAKFHSVATVKLAGLGLTFTAESCGRTHASAGRFAQAFVLEQIAEALTKSAATLDQPDVEQLRADYLEKQARAEEAKRVFDAAVGRGESP
jgi:hypothetical protein